MSDNRPMYDDFDAALLKARKYSALRAANARNRPDRRS